MKYYSVRIATGEIIEGPIDKPWDVNPKTEAIVTTDDLGGNLSDKTYYLAFRERAYPSLGDQLDALWKGGADMEAMKLQIVSVKTKYPKP